MSSDEESFVILGSSPVNSMPSQEPSFNNANKLLSIEENIAPLNLSQKNTQKLLVSKGEDPILSDSSGAGSLSSLINSAINQQGLKSAVEANNVNLNSESSSSTNTAEKNDFVQVNVPRESLAASFILGEIDSNVIKVILLYSDLYWAIKN